MDHRYAVSEGVSFIFAQLTSADPSWDGWKTFFKHGAVLTGWRKFFVLGVLFLGIAIHAIGLIGIQTGDEPRWVHLVMFFADASAFIGILSRRAVGYWVAVALFVYAVASLCIMSLYILLEARFTLVGEGNHRVKPVGPFERP